MAENPGKTIPELFGRKYEVDATYTFFNREEATPENIQAGHREVVRQELQKPGKYILPEDTTTVSYSHLKEIEGLGPVGPGKKGQQGFLVHSTLVLRWPEELLCPEGQEAERPPVEVVGILHQQYLVRKGRRRKHSRAKRKRPPKKGELESQKWEDSVQQAGPAPANREAVQCIRVCDREADIYEHIKECETNGYGYVIRAGRDRKLEAPATGPACGSLFEVVRAQAPVGRFELHLRARPGQPGRIATLAVASVKVQLRSPRRPGHGPGFLPAIECRVVRVWEETPPEGAKALEWILLTDQPAETFEQMLEVALIYSSRWIVEEFHKALKTGCGAEKLQFEKGHRFFSTIAIMSLTALRLIHLRERFRLNPDAPVEQSGLNELEIRILETKLKRTIRTVREAGLALGRLGGHMNRRSDGMPGWITLWRGMAKLRLLKEGAQLALAGMSFQE